MRNGDRVLIEFEVRLDPESIYPIDLYAVREDDSLSNGIAVSLTQDFKYRTSDDLGVKFTVLERNFKVGDRVECPLFGSGVVLAVDSDGGEFPIHIHFDSNVQVAYTSDGRYDAKCNPTLTWS